MQGWQQRIGSQVGGGRRTRGVSMVAVMVALVALIGTGALAVDLGVAWSARTQLQGVADASALAAAAVMVDPVGATVNLSGAETEADAVAGQNETIMNTMGLDIPASNVTFGFWDLDQRQLLTAADGVDTSDPEQLTGVHVVVNMDSSAMENTSAPAFLSLLLGRDGFDVRAEATAYRGYEGFAGPGRVDLPVAIDCCDISETVVPGKACSGNYPDKACCLDADSNGQCDHNLPNSSLINPNCEVLVDEVGTQDPAWLVTGIPEVTCLEFNSDPEQNACWTQFSGSDPSINPPNLSPIVQNGYQGEIHAGDQVFLDNGDKTPVIDDIHDKLHEVGGPGVDRYPPFNVPYPDTGGIYHDSWVVMLPVFRAKPGDPDSCNNNHCAGNITEPLTAFVCYEIIEVEVTPSKEIKGRFLCPGDAPPGWPDQNSYDDLWKTDEQCVGSTNPECGKCRLAGVGGFFGNRVQFPVLVE